MERWKLVDSRPIVSNRWLEVLNNRYEHAGRQIEDYFVVRRSPFVLVVALDARDNLLLVRQYRAATDAFYLALPAGYIGAGETPQQAAQRELFEETGAWGSGWVRVGQLDPLPGYIDSRAFVYRCAVPDLTAVGTAARPASGDEEGELVETVVVSRATARRMIGNGEITEMQAVAALLLADVVAGS